MLCHLMETILGFINSFLKDGSNFNPFTHCEQYKTYQPIDSSATKKKILFRGGRLELDFQFSRLALTTGKQMREN